MSPMWLTSNTPTPPRTARCSHIRLPLDGYSTGMSQPPKLTILAPRRLCSALSAVLRRLELVGGFPESIPFTQADREFSTHVPHRQKSPPWFLRGFSHVSDRMDWRCPTLKFLGRVLRSKGRDAFPISYIPFSNFALGITIPAISCRPHAP